MGDEDLPTSVLAFDGVAGVLLEHLHVDASLPLVPPAAPATAPAPTKLDRVVEALTQDRVVLKLGHC